MKQKENGNKNNRLVYVLDINGKPLMPTSRCGKVRHMLKRGEAKVVLQMPFTIQLLYEPETHVVDENLHVGIDTGSKHIGISVCSEKRELFSAEILPEDGMKSRMDRRRMYRRDRRNRKTRYRKPRFNNRTHSKKEGWLAPSVMRLCNTHIVNVLNLFKILPLSKENTKCIVEVCSFDTQKLKDTDIQGVEYQQGETLGFVNKKCYVRARDGHKCQCCNGKSGDNRIEVHHIIYRSHGGTNDVNNLITVCSTCHDKIHAGKITPPKLKAKPFDFKNAAKVSSMKTRVVSELKNIFDNVEVTYGYITKYNRKKYDIKKTHCQDAFAMCGYFSARQMSYNYVYRQVRRHKRELQVHNFTKGHERKPMVASKYLPDDFMQYDKVYCKSLDVCGFIYGSTNGYATLKDINGNKVMKQNSITTKKLRLLYRKHGGFMIDMVKNCA